jgi:hypothetical protein
MGTRRPTRAGRRPEREVEAVFNVEHYGSHLAMAQDAACIAEALHEALLHEEDVGLPLPSARE